MSKIIRNLTILTVAVLLSSCSLLDERPTTSLSETAVFKTEEGLESLITGCYQAFREKYLWCGQLYEFLQEASLLVHWKGDRTTENFQQCLDMTFYSTNTVNQEAFKDLYAAINRCNNILTNIGDSPVSEDFKNEIKGEARFLRAVLYFNAVRMWGDLPLVLSSPRNLEEANIPRSSYLDVYRQILEDLDYAETNMRDFDRQVEATGERGRACKWAASSYKALVYLQIASILYSPDDQPFRDRPDFKLCGVEDEKAAWTKALEYAEKVIEKGPYRLADNYCDLFKWETTADHLLRERIFALNSSNLKGYSSYCQYTLPNYPAGTAQVSAKASNYGRTRPERWVFQTWASRYGGMLGSGRGDGLTGVFVSCGDPRFDASYIHTSYYNQNKQANIKIYPSSGCVSGIVAGSDQDKFAPYFKKYLHPAYNANNGEADFYMMRFAELYLIAAEAAASLSTSVGDSFWNKALQYVEVIHARARKSVAEGREEALFPSWEDKVFSSKEELISAIFWERLFEMSGEGHEFFDMRRRGAQWVIDNITRPFNEFLQKEEQGPNIKSPVEGTGYWQTSYFGRVFPTDVESVRKSLLLAFPDQEIRTNAAIDYKDQNPYIIR